MCSPHLIHGSLDHPDSAPKRSRSVQPFLHGKVHDRDRQTATDRPSVTIGCIYVRSTAMRHKAKAVERVHPVYIGSDLFVTRFQIRATSRPIRFSAIIA